MKLILPKVKQNQLSSSLIINELTYTNTEINITPDHAYSVISYYHDIIPFYSSKKLNRLLPKVTTNSPYYKYVVALKSWLAKHEVPEMQVPIANIKNDNNFISNFDLLLRHSNITISSDDLVNPYISFKDFIFNQNSSPFIILEDDMNDIIHLNSSYFNLTISIRKAFSYTLTTSNGTDFGVTPQELRNALDNLYYMYDIEKVYMCRSADSKSIFALPKEEQNKISIQKATKFYLNSIDNYNKEKTRGAIIDIPEIELITKGYDMYIPILVIGDTISGFMTLNRILNTVDRFTGFTKLNTSNKKTNLLSRLDAIYTNYKTDIEASFNSIGLDDSFFNTAFFSCTHTMPINHIYQCSMTSSENEPLSNKIIMDNVSNASRHLVFFEHLVNNFPFTLYGNNKNDSYKSILTLIKYWMCIRKITGSFDFLFNTYSCPEYFFEEDRFLLGTYKIRMPRILTKTLINNLDPSLLNDTLFKYKEVINTKKKSKLEQSQTTTNDLIILLNNMKTTNPELGKTIKEIEDVLNIDGFNVSKKNDK